MEESPLNTPQKDSRESLNTSSEPASPSSYQIDDTLDETSGSGILGGSGMFRDPTIRTSPYLRQVSKMPKTELYHVHKTSNQVPTLAGQDKLSPDASTRDHKVQSISSGESTLIGARTDQAPATTQPTQNSVYSDPLSGPVKAAPYGATDIAALLRSQGKRVSTYLGASPMGYYEKVYGMWAGGQKHYSDVDGLQSDDNLVDYEEESDTAQAEMRFRNYFALPSSEKLVASFFGHLLRVLPLYGKLYIGTTRLCFRSLLPGTRTKVCYAPYSYWPLLTFSSLSFHSETFSQSTKKKASGLATPAW